MKPSPRPLRIAKRLLFRLLHAGRAPHSVTARCAGVFLRFNSNCRIAEDLYANAFERKQRAALDRLIEPGTTAIDVGANLGFYTCLLAERVGPAGRVIAVEPTPSVYNDMTANVSLNGYTRRVAPLPIALSESHGTAQLNIYAPGDEVYNSLSVAQAANAETAKSVIEVETQTLDAVLAEVGVDKPCFVKIDVEGFQHQVLLSGVERLRSMPRLTLMVELNDAVIDADSGHTAENTLELLGGCGFTPFIADSTGGLIRLRDTRDLPAPFNVDVFFLKTAPSGLLAA